MATRKKFGFLCRARCLPGIPKGVVRSRWSVDVIIVTKVIAMTKVNERKRSARICFGIPFSPKSHRRNRSHYRDRSLFFHCHKRSFLRWSEFMLRYYPESQNSPPTTDCNHRAHYNHYTRYNGKPLYRVQQNHQLRGFKEITPSGNSLAH